MPLQMASKQGEQPPVIQNRLRLSISGGLEPQEPTPNNEEEPGDGSPTSFPTRIKNENLGDGPDMSQNDALRYLQMILTSRVYDVSHETPLQFAKNISTRLNNQVFLKREDLQPVFSFKCRGAYNRIAQMNDEEKSRGVICVSAGNHAQGVALAAKKLGIKAIIVMPKGSPEIKWANVKRLGAELIFFGNDFDEAKAECLKLAKEWNMTFIHPYDDPYVIAGQGTIGMEILRQHTDKKLDAIFVCVGGGGLISGVATYVKCIRPDIKVFGVNAEDSDAMTKSLNMGYRVELNEAGLFADGTSIRVVGVETFRLARKYVDGMITVSNDEICAAIKDTFDDTRSIVEPSGALALAGLKKYLRKSKTTGGNYVAILSGANMDFNRLRFVAERAKLGEHREAILSVRGPENKSKLQNVINFIYPRNITEIAYRYRNPKEFHMLVTFSTEHRKREIEQISTEMAKHDIKTMDMTENEVAKSHGRFLIGGKPDDPNLNERFLRFRFRERPGAFKRFFEVWDDNFEVSLIHYRNLGGDVGRILLGVKVPVDQKIKFDQFLNGLTYPFVDESENEICKELFTCFEK